MPLDLRGRGLIIEPLRGESDFEGERRGRIEGIVQRPGFWGPLEYYLVRLDEPLAYRHPSVSKLLNLTHVLLTPDHVALEWAYTGGGPPGLPILIKVWGVLPDPSLMGTNYVTGTIFPLARAVAKSVTEGGV